MPVSTVKPAWSMHLFALVPGDRAEQLLGQFGGSPGASPRPPASAQRPSGRCSSITIAGGPLNQGAHGGIAVLADDQVAFPVPGHGPVLDLGGPLADHDHARDPALGSRSGACGAALGPPAAQAASQLTAQLTPALDEQRLVDRLVAHLHHRIIGELEP